jgi:hypothetical protein
MSVAASDQVSAQRLLWAAACCALAAIANLQTLPVWVIAIAFIAGGVRVLLAVRGFGAPPRAVLLASAAFSHL